jgi:hypothetical protein
MLSKISSIYFQILFIPLFLLLIGVIAKRLGRRDGDDSCQLNDFAVGTSVLLMTFSIMLADFRNINDLNELVIILSLVFISIDHDRNRTWERNSEGLPINKKRIWVGIIFPNIVCASIFGIYQAYKVGVL